MVFLLPIEVQEVQVNIRYVSISCLWEIYIADIMIPMVCRTQAESFLERKWLDIWVPPVQQFRISP